MFSSALQYGITGETKAAKRDILSYRRVVRHRQLEQDGWEGPYIVQLQLRHSAAAEMYGQGGTL